jgi:hypothetical protein
MCLASPWEVIYEQGTPSQPQALVLLYMGGDDLFTFSKTMDSSCDITFINATYSTCGSGYLTQLMISSLFLDCHQLILLLSFLDINECTTAVDKYKHNCHALATCTNTAGSFTCACKSGYTGNGVDTCTGEFYFCLLDGLKAGPLPSLATILTFPEVLLNDTVMFNFVSNFSLIFDP